MLSSQQVVLPVPSFIHGETGADLARNLPSHTTGKWIDGAGTQGV